MAFTGHHNQGRGCGLEKKKDSGLENNWEISIEEQLSLGGNDCGLWYLKGTVHCRLSYLSRWLGV